MRRSIIRELWAPSGEHVLEPPRALRDSARAIGFAEPKLELRGHAAMEARAARAYEEFVAPGVYRFRARENAGRLRNVVKFNWEMVGVAGGEVVAVGLEVIVLDEEGRIGADFQFIEG